MTALTRIGASWVKVTVTSAVVDHYNRTRYVVTRIMPDGSIKQLLKWRSAAALQPVRAPMPGKDGMG